MYARTGRLTKVGKRLRGGILGRHIVSSLVRRSRRSIGRRIHRILPMNWHLSLRESGSRLLILLRGCGRWDLLVLLNHRRRLRGVLVVRSNLARDVVGFTLDRTLGTFSNRRQSRLLHDVGIAHAQRLRSMQRVRRIILLSRFNKRRTTRRRGKMGHGAKERITSDLELGRRVERGETCREVISRRIGIGERQGRRGTSSCVDRGRYGGRNTSVLRWWRERCGGSGVISSK